MATFTTRIELHDSDWSDYTMLHTEMGKRGFTQFITADDGLVYELPPAEYNLIADLTRQQVVDLAKAAASSIVKSYAVLVTESAGRRWHGLKRA